MNDCFSTYERKEIPYERFRALIRPKELYAYDDNLVGDVYVYAHCYTGNPEESDYNPNAKDWIEVRLNCPALNRQYPSWEIAEIEKTYRCRIFCIGYIKPAAIGRLMREYKLDVMHENKFFTPAEEALLFLGNRERRMVFEEEFLRFLMEGYIWPGLYESYRMARAIMNHEGDLSFSAYIFDDNAPFMKIRKEWTSDVFRRRFKPSHREFIRISERVFPMEPPINSKDDPYSKAIVNGVYASFNEEDDGNRLFIAEQGIDLPIPGDVEELLPARAQMIFERYIYDMQSLDERLLSPLECWAKKAMNDGKINASVIARHLWNAKRDIFIRRYAEALSAAWDEKAKRRLDPEYRVTTIDVWAWFGKEDRNE